MLKKGFKSGFNSLWSPSEMFDGFVFNLCFVSEVKWNNRVCAGRLEADAGNWLFCRYIYTRRLEPQVRSHIPAPSTFPPPWHRSFNSSRGLNTYRESQIDTGFPRTVIACSYSMIFLHLRERNIKQQIKYSMMHQKEESKKNKTTFFFLPKQDPCIFILY